MKLAAHGVVEGMDIRWECGGSPGASRLSMRKFVFLSEFLAEAWTQPAGFPDEASKHIRKPNK